MPQDGRDRDTGDIGGLVKLSVWGLVGHRCAYCRTGVGGSLSEKLFGHDIEDICQVPKYDAKRICIGMEDMPRRY